MSPPITPEVFAYRFLQRALFFCLFVHALAMLSMAVVLAPAMDMSIGLAERAEWVASHPWRWRVGWLPWQGCALSDLLVSLGLCRWVWAKPSLQTQRRIKGWAALSLLATFIAVVPEQLAEAYASLWMPTLSLEDYAITEPWLLVMTGTYGGLAYVVMLIAWVMCAVQAAPQSRWRRLLVGATFLDAALFTAAGLLVVSVTQELGYTGFVWVERFNQVAFPLLALINVGLAGVVGEAAGTDFFGGIADMLRPIPFLRLRSDIVDVVYLNWWVPSERIRAMLPGPLKLLERDGRTPLSILHYRHGGFGWAFLGPLRRWLPSPIQSNWRAYCDDAHIFFLHVLISERPHQLGARLLSHGLPAVLDTSLKHKRREQIIEIEANVHQLKATVIEDPTLPIHPDTALMIKQRGAIDWDGLWAELRVSEIDIPIDLSTVRPARIERCVIPEYQAVIKGCEGFAFVVPEVRFSALGDRALSSTER